MGRNVYADNALFTEIMAKLCSNLERNNKDLNGWERETRVFSKSIK
jgi:hypothetical protein